MSCRTLARTPLWTDEILCPFFLPTRKHFVSNSLITDLNPQKIVRRNMKLLFVFFVVVSVEDFRLDRKLEIQIYR